MTKKVVNLLWGKVQFRENPGYAHEFAHPWKKILLAPMEPLH